MTASAATLPAELRPTRFGAAVVATVATTRRTANAIWPPFDLFVRLWLAQAFFVSGLIKLANWDATSTNTMLPNASPDS